VAATLADSQFESALQAVESESATPEEKAEMLMEVAMGLQAKPKSAEQLQQAVDLYDRALSLCPAEAPLLRARLLARCGTALQALPEGGTQALVRARDGYEAAIPVLKEKGLPAEAAEAEMNLGLVMQALAGSGQGRIHDAIQCYHRALRVFSREEYPQEFAIVHNNLAIAYLSIPMSDERAKMREALAVQSFEEVLRVINMVDHPAEYAMIQNNLGNALQYAASGHPLENNLRALVAYDEALKVRNPDDTPVEYANTIANKANVLRNLPDPEDAVPGTYLQRARALYAEARIVFNRFGQAHAVSVVDEAIAEVVAQLQPAARGNGHGAHLG
jgi:tetratricopeptide (TPR) repeat protein